MVAEQKATTTTTTGDVETVERKERKERIHQSIPISSSKVGWIIGKQGIQIQHIQKRSGCSAITVSDSPTKDFGREWNYVQISGTTRSVDRAKKLLYLRLESFPSTASEPRYSGRQDQRKTNATQPQQPEQQAVEQ